MPYHPDLPAAARIQVTSPLPLGTCIDNKVHPTHEVRERGVEPFFCDGNLDREEWGIRQAPVVLRRYLPPGYTLVPDDVVATMVAMRQELEAYRDKDRRERLDASKFLANLLECERCGIYWTNREIMICLSDDEQHSFDEEKLRTLRTPGPPPIPQVDLLEFDAWLEGK